MELVLKVKNDLGRTRDFEGVKIHDVTESEHLTLTVLANLLLLLLLVLRDLLALLLVVVLSLQLLLLISVDLLVELQLAVNELQELGSREEDRVVKSMWHIVTAPVFRLEGCSPLIFEHLLRIDLTLSITQVYTSLHDVLLTLIELVLPDSEPLANGATIGN